MDGEILLAAFMVVVGLSWAMWWASGDIIAAIRVHADRMQPAEEDEDEDDDDEGPCCFGAEELLMDAWRLLRPDSQCSLTEWDGARADWLARYYAR